MAGRLSRRRLGDLCLLCSALILECVALFGVRTVLAAHQLEGQFNLVGETRLEVPLPSARLQSDLPTENSPSIIQSRPAATESSVDLPTETPPVQDLPPVTGLSNLPTAIPSSPTPESPTPGPPTPLSFPTVIPEIVTPESPTPAPVNSTGRIVRLVIPRLGVDRAVVPLGFYQEQRGRGGLEYRQAVCYCQPQRPDRTDNHLG